MNKSVKFEQLMQSRGVTDFSTCQDQYYNTNVQMAWEMFLEGIEFEDKEQIIGTFVPNKGNTNKEFYVVSKQPTSSDFGGGFEGVKYDGEEYHVYTSYWIFVPA